MLHQKPVFVVVPARDEFPRIHRVISQLPAFVDAVVVVDDGSVDGTHARARSALAGRGVAVRNEVALGVGAAIARGYRICVDYTDVSEAAIAVMAGDDQMDPGDLEAVVTPIVRGECSYVKGNRFAHADGASAMPWDRKLGGHFFSRATSIAIGQPVHDSQCGFTAISRECLVRLLSQPFWPSFGYPNVVLGDLARMGARVKEVPVRAVYADEVSRLRAKHVFAIAGLIAREAWKTHCTIHAAQGAAGVASRA